MSCTQAEVEVACDSFQSDAAPLSTAGPTGVIIDHRQQAFASIELSPHAETVEVRAHGPLAYRFLAVLEGGTEEELRRGFHDVHEAGAESTLRIGEVPSAPRCAHLRLVLPAGRPGTVARVGFVGVAEAGASRMAER